MRSGTSHQGALAVALGGLAALALAMGIGRFAFTPLLPMMQADAGLTLREGAWLASANYAGYLAGALSARRLPPAIGVRGGLALIGLATLGMGLLEGAVAWAALRFAAGVASGWVMVHISAWALARLAPLGRPFLGGVVYTGVGLGVAAAGLACLGFMASGVSSRASWLMLGAATLVVSALLLRKMDSGERKAERRSAPIAWSLVVPYGAYGFGYIIPATFLPAMAKQAIDDPFVFGWAWPAFGAAAVASTLAAGALNRWWSNRAIWIACQLVLALGVAAPAIWPGMPGILIASLCVGGTFVVITQVALQEARVIGGEHAARLMAALTAAFAAGQIAGPPFVSLWLAAGGTFNGALLFACALTVTSTLTLFERRIHEQAA
jgi:MFS family permease